MPGSPASNMTLDAMPEDVRHLMETCAVSPGEQAGAPRLDVASQSAVFDYWLSLPRPTGIPDASAFNPAAVRRHLPSLTILSLTSPDEISHRLVGTEVTSSLDTNLTGANLLDFVPPETRLQCARDMHEMGYRPCAWQARHVTRYASGLISYVKTLYLPLRAPDGQPPRILGMHRSEQPTGIGDKSDTTIFGAGFDRMIWIDVGFGVPG
ncbi:PAS domain-containing protein [Parvibaculum sp.]|uniref:PAS domain-containing protein n=1 Tax=Parvibaculum sp. TaxID=2024848 RepID=UPI002FD8BB35